MLNTSWRSTGQGICQCSPLCLLIAVPVSESSDDGDLTGVDDVDTGAKPHEDDDPKKDSADAADRHSRALTFSISSRASRGTLAVA